MEENLTTLRKEIQELKLRVIKSELREDLRWIIALGLAAIGLLLTILFKMH